MKKSLGKKMIFPPCPVLIVGTYDESGKANAMNAAWGIKVDTNQILISMSKHKTTDNFAKTGAFTVAFATVKTLAESDYFGIVSGNSEDKIAKAGFTAVKSEYVNAPVFKEYPLTMECLVESFDDGLLIGNIVNVTVDEEYLDDSGNIDVDKMEIICFDEASNSYRLLGPVVGKAFRDGFAVKER